MHTFDPKILFLTVSAELFIYFLNQMKKIVINNFTKVYLMKFTFIINFFERFT